MAPADFSQSLTAFFEGKYLPQMLEQAAPEEVKRYRNAIGQAALYLGNPATLGDLVDPSFSKSFQEHLAGKGFSAKRAKSFADCLAEIHAAARLYRRPSHDLLPTIEEIERSEGEEIERPRPFVYQGRTAGTSLALLSMILPDDQVCHGGLPNWQPHDRR
jgi:hypothetical protein